MAGTRNGFPGITNYVERIPGTDVTCYIGVRDSEPEVWLYSLWTDDETVIATDRIDATGWGVELLSWQVARLAFILTEGNDS